jgi:curved DNA-binding protein CbpA
VDSLAIGALERFVLTNVDGRRTPAELADLTGVAEGDIERILDKLASLGAVHLGAGAATNGEAAKGEATKSETIDLDPQVREWVDARVANPDLDHYAVLDLARDVERKAIKAAYYALAAKLHTDRYFGKNLGAYKSKLEQVFSRVTLAHDVLASKQKREEYDAYLAERDRTQAYERLMAMVEGDGDLGEELRGSTSTRAATPPSGAGTPASTPARPASVPPPAADSKPGAPSASAPLTAEQERARREMLARRLRGQVTGRRAQTSDPQVSRPTADPRTATEAVKRMYEERKDAARRTQAQKFIDAADQAMTKEDVVAAANHLRLAVRYTDDAAVRQRYETINRRARDVMAEAYLKQARYEEQQQRWREAAQSYAKAIEGRPDDPDMLLGAANALRREGRDLHAAARYGEAAVQKNPNNVAFRVTLGHVYLDAGLYLRARSELEQALKLEHGHAKATELLAQVKKLVS